MEAPRLLAVAVRFLTRLPAPEVAWGADDLRRAQAYFPLVGLLVAGVGIAVRAVVGAVLDPVVATIAAVAAMVAVTGALHEDGLADTVDGFWGAAEPARRLEIMRDSRIGAYGVVALVVVLGLRVALLAPADLGAFARLAVTGHVVARAAGVALVAWQPAASPTGSGAQVVGSLPRGAAFIAGATVLVVLAFTAGPWLWAPLAAAAVGTVLVGRAARRRIGGVTGDVIGAANQVAHVLAVAALAAVLR